MRKAWMFAAALAGMGLLSPAGAQEAPSAADQALLVVYGPRAHSREGDIDHREQIFFSVPSESGGRLYVRIFDPEMSGEGDFTYGGRQDSVTAYRVFGGEGAFSAADRPTRREQGERPPRGRSEAEPVTGPGRLLREATYTFEDDTDGRWVTLGAVRAQQGEVVDGRAYFRLDVQGMGGDDGNGFSVQISEERDRARPPEGLEVFSYEATLRWPGTGPATRVRLRNPGGPLTVQNFDAANADLALVEAYRDRPLRPSGQDFWAVQEVDSTGEDLAISLQGGFEQPNDIMLSVFDATGAPVPLHMPPYRAPDPARPTAVGTGRPLADCSSVAFDGSGSLGSPLMSFAWDFGDGRGAEDTVIVHRYDAPGRHTARLRVLEPGTRPGRGHETEVPVHVRRAPRAAAGADIVVAPGEPVAFDGTGSTPSDSPITLYRWSFGDGTTAEGAQAEKVYDAPGSYRAALRVSDDSAHPCNFGVGTRVVTVNFPPVAEAGTDQSAIVGQQVTLSAAASYDVDGWILSHVWDMGDGTMIEGESVTHVYETSGTYRAVLRVTDDSGVANDVSSDGMTIRVNAPPVPRITGPGRILAAGETVTLDATASTDDDGAILSYRWVFGDGAMGDGEQVDYAWARPGAYTVRLTVTDNSGTSSAEQSTTQSVRVNAPPVADAGPDQMRTASEVTFDAGRSHDSDGEIVDWQWEFGDGRTGSGQSVTHAYRRPGFYEVALVVRDDSGAPLNTDRDTMTVRINAAPIADAGPPQTVAPGQEVVLDAGGSVDPDGAIADYLWTFADGTTKQGERIAHVFEEPGLYRIGLTVTDVFPGGAARDETEVLITVNQRPVAVAGPDLLVAPDDMVTFDAGGSFDPDGRITSYRWEFEDLGRAIKSAAMERAYVSPGTWSVELVVTDDSGVQNATARDSRSIRVNAAPAADAGPRIETDRLLVKLDGSGSGDPDGDALIYRWDLGDGSTPVYGERVSHYYPRAGRYPVTLRVDDGTGLSNATDIDATTVVINARPLALAGGNREVCSGDPILFDASGSVDPDGDLLRYGWDFGDGTQSDIVNPLKTYEQPGSYQVTLTVRDSSGSDRDTAIDRIAAVVREGPIADAGLDRTVCTNRSVRFDGTGSTDADGAVNAYAWTFGDGGEASGDTPVYIFEEPGDYNVTLTITGEAVGLCSPLDTDTATYTVVPAPGQEIIAPDRTAAGEQTTFAASLSTEPGITPLRHVWTFSDGTGAEGAEVSHSFEAPGVYFVDLSTSLEGGHSSCSEVTSRHKVIVNAAPEPVIDGPDVAAVGEAVVFGATGSSDSDGALTGFDWDFGDGARAEGAHAPHRFTEAGEYEVVLRVTDDSGTSNATQIARQRVRVNPAPAVGLVAPPPICAATPEEWSVSVPEGTGVTWDFGDGTRMSGARVSHAYGAPGLYPVTLSLDDGRGLENSRQSEVVHAHVNAPPVAQAGPDRTICPGDTLRFDAGESLDPDGEITAWIWEFSDGVSLSGPVVERRFDDPGAMEVRLRLRDDSGAACGVTGDTARILVNAPPGVDAGPDRSLPVGAAHDVLRVDATGARDPDGQGLRISWDFGDGNRAAGAVARHSYAAPGEYTLTVRAEDSTGLACGVATDTATITALSRG
ncbi:PKD domain-containing protein [Salinihabitans flavidus]|nr:PKD domain-containing protein [Salinihabitans flavidus]